jgi:hypothetical protein
MQASRNAVRGIIITVWSENDEKGIKELSDA